MPSICSPLGFTDALNRAFVDPVVYDRIKVKCKECMIEIGKRLCQSYDGPAENW